MEPEKKIDPFILIRHPEYEDNFYDWRKWRLAFKGGRNFIEEYTKKFSSRETDADFALRKCITHCPAFAKAALTDIKNSIFQRVTDISRTGGSKIYQEAMLGKGGGVDRRSSSMNDFIGRKILPDLLSIGKVGCFVDRAPVTGQTVRETRGKNPYLYTYPAENILSWTESMDSESEFDELLLLDIVEKKHEQSSLTCGVRVRYRHMWIDPTDGFVRVEFRDDEGKKIDADWNLALEPMKLNLRKIPFVVFQLSGSLMEDVADYQVSLLNLSSSDIAYALKANFPFYIEKADLREQFNHLMQGAANITGQASDANLGGPKEINIGPVTGRQYSQDPPQFIHPSPEPLEASMKLREQLKEEIRLLVNLSLSSVRPKMASAESKSLDMEGLESGLSYIGLELEHGERQIAEYWASYEGNNDVPTIKYPERYDLQSGEDKRKDVDTLLKQGKRIGSKTLQQAIARRAARLLAGSEVSVEEQATIYQEINNAEMPLIDPDSLSTDIEDALVTRKTASKIKGYPDGESEKAATERVEQAAKIAEAQGIDKNPAARGIPEQSVTPRKDAAAEKKGKPQRGPGRKVNE